MAIKLLSLSLKKYVGGISTFLAPVSLAIISGVTSSDSTVASSNRSSPKSLSLNPIFKWSYSFLRQLFLVISISQSTIVSL